MKKPFNDQKLNEKSKSTGNKSLLKALLIINIILLFLCLFFLIPLAIRSPVRIVPGEVGVVLDQGKVQDYVLYEGIHFIIPRKQTVVKVDVRVQRFQGKLVALSSDNKYIEYKVLLNYGILPDKAHLVYKEQLAFNSLIKSLVEDAIKTVTLQYKQDEVPANITIFKDSVSKDLKLMMERYHLYLFGFAIEDVTLRSP